MDIFCWGDLEPKFLAEIDYDTVENLLRQPHMSHAEESSKCLIIHALSRPLFNPGSADGAMAHPFVFVSFESAEDTTSLFVKRLHQTIAKEILNTSGPWNS
jgi:hypothetical protein